MRYIYPYTLLLLKIDPAPEVYLCVNMYAYVYGI